MIRKSTIGIISVLLFSSCVAQEPVPALPFCTAEKDCKLYFTLPFTHLTNVKALLDVHAYRKFRTFALKLEF